MAPSSRSAAKLHLSTCTIQRGSRYTRARPTDSEAKASPIREVRRALRMLLAACLALAPATPLSAQKPSQASRGIQRRRR